MVVSSQAFGLAMRGRMAPPPRELSQSPSYTSAASESDWRNSILATDSNLRVKKTGWLFNGVQPDSFPKGPGESAQQSDFVHEHVQWNERVSGQARRVGRMCRRQSDLDLKIGSFRFLLFLGGGDKLLEPVGAAFPKGALCGQPRFDHSKLLLLDGTRAHATFLARLDQTVVLKKTDVFHEGRQSHVEWHCQVADARRAFAQPPQHGSASGIGKRLEDAVQPPWILFHKAKYFMAKHLVQELTKLNAILGVGNGG